VSSLVFIVNSESGPTERINHSPEENCAADIGNNRCGTDEEGVEMFCPECGTENPENAKFCGNCRHPLSASTKDPSRNHIDDVVEIDNGQPAVPDGMKYGILAASIFIPFIGLIMGIIYLAQNESGEKKEV
jgi:hypothetical protein